MQIGASLPAEEKQRIIEFLKKNVSCFAWSHEDMVGIEPDIITHKLNVDPNSKPVKQKRRKFAPERNMIVNEEVDKLLKAGKIREVKYPDWLANVVVVGKKNGKWRVCIDFTDLNKACPKDPFPLPHIDALVDATAGHERLTFLDAYSGYNQILMDPADQEKTAFMTERGIYCYKVMPFGLKNAGATYQRLVNKMFEKQLGDTMEVYIDDMLVKTKKAEDHVDHLQETFEVLKKYGMKLNPSKCSFGVPAGKFLGYIVTQRGIEANPSQVQALINIQSPRNLKEVQKLTGRVAALNRFISRSSDKCHLFYNVLKKNKGFNWTDEHEAALQNLKAYLAQPPLLSKPSTGETLQLYLAVSSKAVSAVLAREAENQQLPVYYVSKSLLDAETRYTSLEKLVLALYMASRKLRHYFESHPIHVMTNYPIKAVLRKPEHSGRMAKWAISLSAHDIRYLPRTAIKSQALADFVADFSPDLAATAEEEARHINKVGKSGSWQLYVDGSSNFRGAGLGIVLKSPQGDMIVRAICCDFKATNNEAEYEALIAGMTLAHDLKANSLRVFSDSLLIVSQVNGEYAAKDSKMASYLELAKGKAKLFEEFSIKQIPRDQNTKADALANLGSALKKCDFNSIPIAHLAEPAISKEVNMVRSDDNQAGSTSWTQPIIAFLERGILPEDKLEARKLRMKATRYHVISGTLFKRACASYDLLQRCLDKDQWEPTLKEFHEGECGSHAAGRSLSNKILAYGYYWPTMRVDAKKYVQKCESCQKHAGMTHQPAEILHPTLTPWPFMRWGMDIVGKLPVAPGQKVFMLALTDYFSKWIEAGAFQQVRDKEVISFLHTNIICRFGVPSEIICDNGSQFISDKTRQFCHEWNISLVTSTPRYPQANGQAESSNKVIINGIKRRLKAKKGRWVEELPKVLWANRTTPRGATGRTPFSLVYGCEAVLPAEVAVPTARYGLITPEANDKELGYDLDSIEELRDNALVRMAAQQQIVARSFNKNVKAKVFKVGDWVLRKVFQNTQEVNAGKLGISWEGPYLIDQVVGKGAYRLTTKDGKAIPRSWNASHLKLYHF